VPVGVSLRSRLPYTHHLGSVSYGPFSDSDAPQDNGRAANRRSTNRRGRRPGDALKMSRQVFAFKLGVNPRTLERWEQGRSKPTEQAAALIWLVRKYPDTLKRWSLSQRQLDRGFSRLDWRRHQFSDIRVTRTGREAHAEARSPHAEFERSCLTRPRAAGGCKEYYT
jgi:transcriptional regulator with XRE-family HTH domain